MTGKYLLPALFFMILVSPKSYGQAADDEMAITNVIDELFNAMELGDSAKAPTTFAIQVTTATVSRDKNNNVVLRRDNTVDSFLKAIAAPRKENWYEETWNTKVQIDGDFAQVWCDYGFYIGNTFSHCGVDAFHLVREKDGWKIFHLADTRRRTDCNVPQHIQDKNKNK